MILDKVYEEFVENTGLRDGIYKTVFLQISEVLEKIKDIKWTKLTYSIDGKNYVTDFSNSKTIPLYIVEIVQNLFDKLYSFPDNSDVILELEYKGTPYSITCKQDEVSIPPELEFIQTTSLFKFFIVTRKVFDVFREFDDLFEFVNSFKTKVNSIYSPLQKKFDRFEAKLSVDTGAISPNRVAATQNLVENLKKSRSDLLKQMESIRSVKEKLIIDKGNVLRVVKSRAGLEAEKSSLKQEFDILKDTYNSYKNKFDRVLDIISEIDIELDEMVHLGNQNTDDHQFLVEKKDSFVEERKTLEGSLNDTKSLMDAISSRLLSLGNTLRKAEQYSMADIDVLTTKVDELEKQYEDTYVALTTTDSEIKHQASKAIMDSTQIEMDKMTPSVIGVADIDKQDIIGHLSTSLQPTSVTTVMNYLRYYFAYHSTKIAVKLSSMHEDIEPSVIQALATKTVITQRLGIFYHIMFSAINFVDNRIDRVILVQG